MIEFAPNPSGPAHIGTLRTYAVAWRLAKNRGERLFVRFDAHNLVAVANRDRKWADEFLVQLERLDLSPDAWEYLDVPGYAGALPDWAVIKRISWSHDENGIPTNNGPLTDVAYYPDIPSPRALPSLEPTDYIAGERMPIVEFGPNPCWGYFAVRNGEGWGIDESLVCLQRMRFRGTTLIVRSYLSTFLRPMIESPASRWFGWVLPNVHYCPVVCDAQGALSKHRLEPDDPGTVAYSMNKLATSELRDRILKSAEIGSGVSLDWREVVEHD